MGMLDRGLPRRAESLPLPIAGPLRRADVATAKAEAFVPLVQAGEATLALLAAVVLRDAAAEGLDPKLLKPDRATHASIGLWRQVLQGVPHRLKRPTLPGLTALRADPGRWGVFEAAVGILVDARNRFAHPVKRVDAVYAQRELPRCVGALLQVLSALPGLEQVTLMRVVQRNPTDGRLQVVPLNGPHATRSPQWVHWPDPPAPDSVLLLNAQAGRWRDLAPLYRWADEHLWAYNRTEQDGQGWSAHWADCVTNHDGAPTPAPGADWLAQRLGEPGPGGDAHLSATDAAALGGGQTALHFQSDTLLAAALEATATPAAAPDPPIEPPRRHVAPWLVAGLLGLVAATAWLALRSTDAGPAGVGPVVPAPAAAASKAPVRALGSLVPLPSKRTVPLTVLKPKLAALPAPTKVAPAKVAPTKITPSALPRMTFQPGPQAVVQQVLDRPRAQSGHHFLAEPCADPSLAPKGGERPRLRLAKQLADRALVIEAGPRGDRWWGLERRAGRWRISHEAAPHRGSACARELARRFDHPLPR